MILHNSSSNADDFDPAQDNSDQLETSSDLTQKDDMIKPRKVNTAKHKKHIVKKCAVEHHKRHIKKYRLKRRSRKHTKRAKKYHLKRRSRKHTKRAQHAKDRARNRRKIFKKI